MALSQWNARLPAKLLHPRDVQQLARRAVELGCVEGQSPFEVHYIADQLRQFSNRQVFATINVKRKGVFRKMPSTSVSFGPPQIKCGASVLSN